MSIHQGHLPQQMGIHEQLPGGRFALASWQILENKKPQMVPRPCKIAMVNSNDLSLVMPLWYTLDDGTYVSYDQHLWWNSLNPIVGTWLCSPQCSSRRSAVVQGVGSTLILTKDDLTQLVHIFLTATRYLFKRCPIDQLLFRKWHYQGWQSILKVTQSFELEDDLRLLFWRPPLPCFRLPNALLISRMSKANLKRARKKKKKKNHL